MAIRLTADRGGTRQSPHRTALVPAAARGVPTLTPEERALNSDAIDTFTAAVGGRQKLLETLAVADGEGSTDRVVACLLDEQYASWSLRRICTYAGITVADLLASYKRALFTAAHVEAAHIITGKLTAIVEDVMTRAMPQPVPCRYCNGQAQVSGTPCVYCQGTGQTLSEPDLDRQKLALELGRLTAQHKAGVVVQQNVAAAAALTGQGTGSLEQLQQVVGDLLFAPGRRRAASPPIIVEADDTEAPDGP